MQQMQCPAPYIRDGNVADMQSGSARIGLVCIPRYILAPDGLRSGQRMMLSTHILVVDDDSAIRTLVIDVLMEEGFQVSSASNGVEALRAVAMGSPDVIVLDLQMPVLDGWGTFRRLRSTGCDTPVLLVSAHGVNAAQRELDADDALAKPFDIAELLARVTALVPH
jgi:CheY-like chemotaxis protein